MQPLGRFALVNVAPNLPGPEKLHDENRSSSGASAWLDTSVGNPMPRLRLDAPTGIRPKFAEGSQSAPNQCGAEKDATSPLGAVSRPAVEETSRPAIWTGPPECHATGPARKKPSAKRASPKRDDPARYFEPRCPPLVTEQFGRRAESQWVAKLWLRPTVAILVL